MRLLAIAALELSNCCVYMRAHYLPPTLHMLQLRVRIPHGEAQRETATQLCANDENGACKWRCHAGGGSLVNISWAHSYIAMQAAAAVTAAAPLNRACAPAVLAMRKRTCSIDCRQQRLVGGTVTVCQPKAS